MWANQEFFRWERSVARNGDSTGSNGQGRHRREQKLGVLIFRLDSAFFFTVGALLGFGGRFGAYDAFWQLFLKGGLEKLTPFREEKVFQVVEGLAVGGVIGNEIALVEKGIEFGVKEFTTSRERRCWLHKETAL